ncbi:hypothetical protein ACI784_05085 [Geodermatophilus sp. SYSU D01186]
MHGTHPHGGAEVLMSIHERRRRTHTVGTTVTSAVAGSVAAG